MARIERRMAPWRKVWTAGRRLSEVARCVRWFENWPQLARIYAGGEMASAFTAYGRQGVTLPLGDPTDVQTAWVVFCTDGYYVPRRAKRVLDLGANIGAFTLFAARCREAETVYALEPVASTFATLQRNVALNQLGNVTLVRQGIGGLSGQRTMHLGVTSPHASIIHRGDSRFESGATEAVDIVTLEQLFEALNLDEVDMAKMDCEGGEVEAILAASDRTLRRIRHLSLEYHYPGDLSNDAQFFGRLERAGFRCTRRSPADRLAQFVRQ